MLSKLIFVFRPDGKISYAFHSMTPGVFSAAIKPFRGAMIKRPAANILTPRVRFGRRRVPIYLAYGIIVIIMITKKCKHSLVISGLRTGFWGDAKKRSAQFRPEEAMRHQTVCRGEGTFSLFP
jgi:hypothetical protein